MKLQLKLLLLLFGYATAFSTYEHLQQKQNERESTQEQAPQIYLMRLQQYIAEQRRIKEAQQKLLEETATYPQYYRPVSKIDNSKTNYDASYSNPTFSERFGDSALVTVTPKPTRPSVQIQQSVSSQMQFPQQTVSHSGPPSSNPHEKFNTKLFQYIAPNNIDRNVVYSPISLQTLMALVSLGAKDQTALELFQGLQLPKDRNAIATMFRNLLQSNKYSGNSHLLMANKVYHSNKIDIKDYFYNVAENSFDSEFESINFQDPVSSSLKINAWVNHKTNSRIQNVISPQGLDPRTQVLLVNAIYFKAQWVKEFSVGDTIADDFFLTPNQKMRIDMMYNDDKFRYAHFTDIKASVLEMPYKDSDLSMMIILPDEYDGLAQLERSLNEVDLITLADKLKEEQVVLRLPKFRIEFEIDMVEPLKNLNIRSAFSQNSDLSEMFINASDQPVGISKIQHKAYIDVNEAGSEAAAASFANVIPLSLTKTVTMSVNHPFMFAIRSPKVVYFVGHVVYPLKM